jgi:general secretion pathway protein G
MTGQPNRGARGDEGGFTLLELCIVVAVLAILAVVGVPQYSAALRTARIGKAKFELRTISTAIDSFRVVNGELPLALGVVGFPGKTDPWGNPYFYLNYEHGTGDGWEAAMRAGLLEAPKPKVKTQSIPPSLLKETAVKQRQLARYDFEVSTAIEVVDTQRRTGPNLPLNSDYDLFTIGPDGLSAISIDSQFSLDDVIRANNGAYFGVASEY